MYSKLSTAHICYIFKCFGKNYSGRSSDGHGEKPHFSQCSASWGLWPEMYLIWPHQEIKCQKNILQDSGLEILFKKLIILFWHRTKSGHRWPGLKTGCLQSHKRGTHGKTALLAAGLFDEKGVIQREEGEPSFWGFYRKTKIRWAILTLWCA